MQAGGRGMLTSEKFPWLCHFPIFQVFGKGEGVMVIFGNGNGMHEHSKCPWHWGDRLTHATQPSRPSSKLGALAAGSGSPSPFLCK